MNALPLTAVAAALLLSGCAAQPASDSAPASAFPPEACGTAFPADAPQLQLKPTSAAADALEPGTRPIALAHEVDRSLTRAGRWHDRADGWSSLALALHSDGARSLALHLSALKLPRRSQLWFCSPDGRVRHGPYREATGGELYTPAVPGDRAHLQIWVPTAARATLAGRLADVQGGLR